MKATLLSSILAMICAIAGPQSLKTTSVCGSPEAVAGEPCATAPKVIHRVDPEYSDEARGKKIVGSVVLSVLVGKDGVPRDVTVTKPLGSGLDEQAVRAVQQWRFQPATVDGEPVATQIRVETTFRLYDKGKSEKAQALPVVPSGEMIGGIISSVPVLGSNGGQAQRVRISSVLADRNLISKVQPVYPANARDAHIQGSCVLKVFIDKEGKVTDMTAVSGHPLLLPVAMDAVKQWRYKPYSLNGQAVDVETRVTVNVEPQ